MRFLEPRSPSLLVILALGTVAHAEPSAMAQARQQAALYRIALMKKDFTAVSEGIAPGFSIVYLGSQKADKAGFMADTKAFWGPLTVKDLKVAVPSAKTVGGGQLFVYEFTVEGTMKGKGPKPSLVKNHSVFQMHRVRKGGAWIVDSGKCLVMKTTVDGKPVP